MKKAKTAPNMTLPHMYMASLESVNLKPYSLAAIVVPAKKMSFHIIQNLSNASNLCNLIFVRKTYWLIIQRQIIINIVNFPLISITMTKKLLAIIYQWCAPSNLPSITTARGSSATVIQGWIWYTMSMGLLRASSDFCITSCESVHRKPLQEGRLHELCD